MQIKELIRRLEELDKNNNDIDGEITIDVFRVRKEGGYEYGGFSPDIQIDLSSDGAYAILSSLIDIDRSIPRQDCCLSDAAFFQVVGFWLVLVCWVGVELWRVFP